MLYYEKRGKEENMKRFFGTDSPSFRFMTCLLYTSDGDLGDYTITEADDGGTEIVLGEPLQFNTENIEEMAKLY